jgi:hypothetical protein
MLLRCTAESEAFGGNLRAKREPEGRASGCAEHNLSDEAICAGLRPEGVLVYAEWLQGRANRPYQKARTVGRIDAAV